MVFIRPWTRAQIHRREDLILQQAAQNAEAAFAHTTDVLSILLADPLAARMLGQHGVSRACVTRSTRLAGNNRAEGLAVLERVVLSKRLLALLSDAELVRWLSRHYPRELAILHDVCG